MPRNVLPDPCCWSITVSPLGLMMLITRSPRNECSMSRQIVCSRLMLFSVAPGAKASNSKEEVKHDPTWSGRKTPAPKLAEGCAFQVVAFTTPSRHTVEPAQPAGPLLVPVNVGTVPTST